MAKRGTGIILGLSGLSVTLIVALAGSAYQYSALVRDNLTAFELEMRDWVKGANKLFNNLDGRLCKLEGKDCQP